ncbi:hypothetical protein PMZ80_009093 [Knufia obscura]|uniref:Telomeric single stranded DNA binding POT1/Cdc13 domain-containing protein n=1 Tax=Knufia obscura TaxID=1635080 RepID=A0ABR0RE43_9EURO|nr:hypothetical protein PMZ80_009093 [Knufia obscura]
MQELRPQIAELLRTCVHPQSLLLRVAYVELIDVKYDRHEQAASNSTNSTQHFDGVHHFTLKFVLTDGELMIQALLHRKLSGLRDAAHIAVGDLLDIRTFAIKKSKRLNGEGHIVYIAIEDCHFLLQPSPKSQRLAKDEQESANIGSRKRRRGPQEHIRSFSADEDESAGGFLRPSTVKRQRFSGPASSLDGEDEEIKDFSSGGHRLLDEGSPTARGAKADPTTPTMKPMNAKAQGVHNNSSKQSIEKSSSKGRLSSTFGARTALSDEEDEDNDFFEEAEVNLATVKKRRTVLQKLDSNAFTTPRSPILDKEAIDHGVKKLIAGSTNTQPVTPYNAAPYETTNEMLQNDLDEEQKTKAKVQFAQPPHQASRRDGTFALSQTPTPLPQQRKTHIAPQAKSVQPTAPSQPTQQSLLPTPPYHTLRSLRDPPPNQPLPNKNYILMTLAFITWTGTSLIHRAGSPFPPKRHLKIVDPSLSSSRPPSRNDQPPQQSGSSTFTAQTAFQDAVTVAVYLDAANFKPVAGTLALFRGLVMQRLGNGDIILNAYGRLKEQRFEEGSGTNVTGSVDANVDDSTGSDTHWFITNEARIRAMGYASKLDYYREWWNEKQQMENRSLNRQIQKLEAESQALEEQILTLRTPIIPLTHNHNVAHRRTLPPSIRGRDGEDASPGKPSATNCEGPGYQGQRDSRDDSQNRLIDCKVTEDLQLPEVEMLDQRSK